MLDSYTKLLAHFNGVDGATAYTAETGQIITFVGTAQLDTAIKRLGSAALLLDGNSDYVTVPDHADWSFGTGKFTIDFPVRFTAISAVNILMAVRKSDTEFWDIRYTGGVTEVRSRGGSATFEFVITNAEWNPVVDTWYHIAIVRDGDDSAHWHFFVNGVEKTKSGETNLDASWWTTTGYNLWIGAGDFEVKGYINGHFDEVRISKGVARWTSNFTPPVREYDKTWKGQSILI